MSQVQVTKLVREAVDVNSPRLTIDKSKLSVITHNVIASLSRTHHGLTFYALEPLYDVLGLDMDLNIEYVKSVEGAKLPTTWHVRSDKPIYRSSSGINNDIVYSRDLHDFCRFWDWLSDLSFVINNDTYDLELNRWGDDVHYPLPHNIETNTYWSITDDKELKKH